jgi:Domain of unknown function (DUF4198)
MSSVSVRPRRFLATCRAAAAVAALAVSALAAAHDFWIEPSTLTAEPNVRVGIDLKVGHEGDTDVLPRNPARFERFVVASPTGTSDVTGLDGATPAGLLRPVNPGVYVVGYRSRHATTELESVKFGRYLREEGLEWLIERRAQQGRSSQVGRERYSRCAKSIITVGEGPRTGFDVALGFRLELVPECDPRDIRLGEPTAFRLLFDGKPIEGVLVRSTALREFECQRSARTDRNGRVLLSFDRPGPWRLNAVHLFEVPPEESATKVVTGTGSSVVVDVDYESLWASLVFEVQGRSPLDKSAPAPAQRDAAAAPLPQAPANPLPHAAPQVVPQAVPQAVPNADPQPGPSSVDTGWATSFTFCARPLCVRSNELWSDQPLPRGEYK